MKKEIRFTVGTNFDLEQIEHFIEINERYQDKKIASVYGSLSTKEINLASARPNFRLGKADRNTFEQYVKKALAHNISIDYTANASMNMSIADMYAAKEDLIDTFKYLERSNKLIGSATDFAIFCKEDNCTSKYSLICSFSITLSICLLGAISPFQVSKIFGLKSKGVFFSKNFNFVQNRKGDSIKKRAAKTI